MANLFEVTFCNSLTVNHISSASELNSLLETYCAGWFKQYGHQNGIASEDALYVLATTIYMMINDDTKITFDQFRGLLKGSNTDSQFRVKTSSDFPNGILAMCSPTQETTDFSEVFLRRIYTYVGKYL